MMGAQLVINCDNRQLIQTVLRGKRILDLIAILQTQLMVCQPINVAHTVRRHRLTAVNSTSHISQS
jgi:hypothetical protein